MGIITRMSLEAHQIEREESFKCSVLSHTLLTHRLHNIVISKPEGFIYQAGQYLKLYLNDGTYRLYSIANAPHDSHIELHIQEPVQDNFIKSFLKTLAPGQDVFISDSRGQLARPSILTNPMILIAGGSAFAPFKAIIEDLDKKSNVDFPVKLFWGLQEFKDIYYLEELERIKRDTDWFNYQIILNNTTESWEGKVGNLTDFIFSDVDTLENVTMHVGGSFTMVKDMFYHALQCNLPQSHFYSDYDLKT
jgi:CDP-4-dehydro-6-deoxyglucose reductase, E3